MSSGPPLGVLFALAALCALCSSSSAAAGGFALMGDSGSSRTPTGPAAGPAAGPTAPATVSGNIVRIERTSTTPGPLMISELQVYDETDTLISVTEAPTITASPTQPGWGGTNGTSFLTDYDTHHPVHTLDAATNFIQLKFSAPKKIKKVVVVLRSDARTAEMSGNTKIRIMNDSTLVKEKVITWAAGDSFAFVYDPVKNVFETEDTEGTVKCTAIMLSHPPSFGDYLHIAELEVYDIDDVNVARTGTIQASSEYSDGWRAANANDGNLTNTYHSQQGGHQWLRIDFGGERKIKSVSIINRVDDLNPRAFIKGSFVRFLKDEKDVHITPPIPNGDKAKFTYRVGKYMNQWKLT